MNRPHTAEPETVDLAALVAELRPYAAKPLGSIRIYTDDIRTIVEGFDAMARELAEARKHVQQLQDFNSRRELDILEIARQCDAAMEALDGIYTYCNDTLSGRADGGPDDRAWQREAVIRARNLARPFARPEIEAAIQKRTALAARGEDGK